MVTVYKIRQISDYVEPFYLQGLLRQLGYEVFDLLNVGWHSSHHLVTDNKGKNVLYVLLLAVNGSLQLVVDPDKMMLVAFCEKSDALLGVDVEALDGRYNLMINGIKSIKSLGVFE